MKTIDLIISVLFSVLIIGLLFMATIPNQKKVECEVENQSPATVASLESVTYGIDKSKKR